MPRIAEERNYEMSWRPTNNPWEMQWDADLWKWLWLFLRHRGPESVATGKVKEHATDAMVASGKVVKRDQTNNGIADNDATMGDQRSWRGHPRVSQVFIFEA